MSGSVGGVCTAWTTAEEVAAIPRYAELDVVTLELTATIASEIMFMLSGQQWPGVCQDDLRPCCGHSFDRCSCSCANILDLGVYPITEIVEIKIDGVALNESEYTVWDYRYIRRTGAEGWPSCQDLRLPSTEVNTFQVTVKYGFAPPQAGATSAAILAGELAMAVLGDEENCRLPRGLVSSIVRQGVTVAFRNSSTSLNEGYTGLQEIDLWLATIPRPLRSAGPSQVFVPEFHKKSTQQTS